MFYVKYTGVNSVISNPNNKSTVYIVMKIYTHLRSNLEILIMLTFSLHYYCSPHGNNLHTSTIFNF